MALQGASDVFEGKIRPTKLKYPKFIRSHEGHKIQKIRKHNLRVVLISNCFFAILSIVIAISLQFLQWLFDHSADGPLLPQRLHKKFGKFLPISISHFLEENLALHVEQERMMQNYNKMFDVSFQADTVTMRQTGETGTDNLSRIQSISSKHHEATGSSIEQGAFFSVSALQMT